MGRALKYIVALFVLLMVIGCRSVRYVPVETIRIDSIAIHDTIVEQKLIAYHDSIVTDDDSSFLSNPYAYSYAKTMGGKLYHSLGIWPFASTRVKVPYYIDKYHTSVETKIVEVEKKLTWWQRFKIKIGEVSIGISLLLALYILLKQTRHRI